MKKSKLEFKDSVVNKEGRVFCMCCSSAKNYTVKEIRLGTIMITACDDCLSELRDDIDEHLNKKLLDYTLGYNEVGGFSLDKSVIKELLKKNNPKTEEEVADILEEYVSSL